MKNETYIEKCPHDKEIPYVMINNEMLQDFSISWEAKGLLSYLIHLPKDWKIHPSHLSKLYEKRGGGDKSIYKMLNELIEAGYCKRVQSKNSDGSFGPFKYYISQFKKFLPHRPLAHAVEAHAVKGDNTKEEVIQINKNNNKGAAAPNPAVVVSSFIQEIEGITQKDKICLSEIESEKPGRVKAAIEWAKTQKIKTTKMALIRWHAETEEEIPIVKKKGDPVINKHYAKVVSVDYEKKGWKIDVLNKHVEISCDAHPTVTCINYTDIEFDSKFSDILKKAKFERKKSR